MTRRPRLEVAPLESRITPVLGAFDVPFAADYTDPIGATNLSGVVDYHSVTAGGLGTGALLDRGPSVVGSRQVLIAAHLDPAVGDFVSFYSRNADGTLRTIDVPVIAVAVNPQYLPGNIQAGNDVAVATLAAVAPTDAVDYPIYTDAQAALNQETGRQFILAGYGLSGTGTSGQADFDLQRMTITATGGQFVIVRPDTNAQSTPLNSNATAAEIEDALASIGLPAQVRMPVFGPYTNTYEVLFLTGANVRRLAFASSVTDPLVNGGGFGQVTFQTLTNGSNDGEFQRLGVAATGGTFALGLGGATTAQLPFNAGEGDIQAALEGILPAGAEVTVRRITSGPAAGQFQISFDTTAGTGLGVLTVDTTALAGAAGAFVLQNDGRRVLRVGANEYDSLSGTTLVSDFSDDGTDDFEGQGDSGGAGFLDTGGGNLAVASIVSYGGFVFGDSEFNTRVSQFTSFIQGITEAPNYTLTLDMQYQRVGADGVPDVIRVAQNAGVLQVFVSSGGGAEKLYYADLAANIASVRLLGTADDETFIVGAGVTRPITVNGVGGVDALVGPDAATTYQFNGAEVGSGTSPTNTVNFSNVQTVVGGAAADTFAFTAGGSFSGTIDGGGGTDTLNLSNGPSANVVLTTPTFDGVAGTASGSALTGTFVNINAIVGSTLGTTDALTGLAGAGIYVQTGGGGTYTDIPSGQIVQYSNMEALTGGAGDDTFNVRSTVRALSVSGGDGNDTFNLSADAPGNLANLGPLGGALTLDGGTGSDGLFVSGTPGNDSVTLRLATAGGDGDFLGLLQGLSFKAFEGAAFDGRGGANAFTLADFTETAYGSPTAPATGIVYRPAGPVSGLLNVGTVFQVAVGSINAGLTVNGDANASGDADTLMILGTSAAGMQSAFGETVSGDGRDQVTVTDTGVSVVSLTGGPLLAVSLAYNGNTPTASTVYVATGNERPTQGDVVTVIPSARLNLVVDAMLPSAAVRPGDRVIIQASETTSAVVTDPAVGPPQTRVTQTADGASVGLVGFETGAPQTAGTGVVAVSTDAGPVAAVQVYDRLTGAFRYSLTPFEGFTAGVTVAVGDVTGDGVPDVVVGAGPGGGPRVAVFDGLDGRLVADFFGYDEEFRGGVNVAVGDLDSDGFADIILGTGPGGGPRVRVLSGRDVALTQTLTSLRDAFVYPAGFRGGVNVAVGDVNGDGTPDVVTSTGSGGGPQVVVLDGTTFAQLSSFFVFDPSSRDGFFVTVGDVNGDGFADIVAGAGFGGPAEVRAFSGQNRAVIADFFVNESDDPFAGPSFAGDVGVRVAVGDVDGDGIGDIITGKGPGSFPVIRTYKVGAVNPQTNALFPTLEQIRRQDVFDAGFGFGVFVASSN